MFNFVVLDVYSVAADRHDVFGVPVLMRPFDEEKYLLLRTDVSHSLVTALHITTHQCKRVSCSVTMFSMTAGMLNALHQVKDLCCRNGFNPRKQRHS